MVGWQKRLRCEHEDMPRVCGHENSICRQGGSEDAQGCAEALGERALQVSRNSNDLDAGPDSLQGAMADPIRGRADSLGGSTHPAHSPVHPARALHRLPARCDIGDSVGADRPKGRGHDAPTAREGRTEEKASAQGSARKTDFGASAPLETARRRVGLVSVPLRRAGGLGPTRRMEARREGIEAQGAGYQTHIPAHAGNVAHASRGASLAGGWVIGDVHKDARNDLRSPSSRFPKGRGRYITVPRHRYSSDYVMVSNPACFHARTWRPHKSAIYRLFSLRTSANCSRTFTHIRAETVPTEGL